MLIIFVCRRALCKRYDDIDTEGAAHSLQTDATRAPVSDRLQCKYMNPSRPTCETGVFRQSGTGTEVSLDVLIGPGSMCVIETIPKPAFLDFRIRV